MAKSRRRRVLLWGAGILAAGFLLWLSQNMCISGYLRYGVTVRTCPEGTPRPGARIEAGSLRRGAEGYVSVSAPIFYTTGPADEVRTANTGRFDATLSLTRGEEKWPLEPNEGWDASGHQRFAKITLPKDLEDGDYQLRADLDTPLGPASHAVPLPIYAPAKIHTLTDRPLYEPGNTLRFRAVILRARDLSPLEGRPGRFVITDPTGQVVYEAKAAAGPFGVADGDFPLDDAAPTGTWWVAYESGDARDAVSVRVEPFTLPRFTVEASTSQPFYGVGAQPVVRGRVVYSSGAPVGGARLDLSWSVGGPWPPPTAWMQGELPKTAYAGDDGRFELRLPRVPGDLVGQAFLQASIAAVDSAGDRVSGSVRVMLSKDAIEASAVTELDGGLVEGFNNRVYLRVTTADGQPLGDTDVLVRRAWDPTDEGKAAKTDADGVAALQIDPGPAVNVLVPAPPVRPPPRPQPVRRIEARDLVSDRALSLADQTRLDGQQARLAPCARFVEHDSEEVHVGLQVGANGRVSAVTEEAGPLGGCVGAIVRNFAFAPGRARVLEIGWTLTEDLPSVDLELEGTPVVPDAVRAAFAARALDARRCLPEDAEADDLGVMLLWRLEPGASRIASEVVRRPTKSKGLPAAVTRCVTDSLQAARLDEPYGDRAQRALGIARILVLAGPRYEATARPDTMRLGYELAVSARVEDEQIGSTKLFLPPGRVPDVRLRATPVLAKAGEEVEVRVLRGPHFSGTLPEKIHWRHEGTSHEMELDDKTRTARFTVPEGASGWFEVDLMNARALVFARPTAELAVSVKTDREVYAPGAAAKLSVRTTAGGAGTPAAVGLIGVDQTLGQLATLPGPDAMARLRPQVEMRGAAFGVLDAHALTLGRVRGAAAAAAIVTRVRSVPSPEDLDRYVSADGSTSFDPVEALTDGFYRVLSDLYEQVRAWEKAAPKDEVMRPATMAKLWRAASEKAAQGAEPVVDAYGRPLTLDVLPDDLLALADPRAVVADGTRLPEDVDNWIDWVREARP